MSKGYILLFVALPGKLEHSTLIGDLCLKAGLEYFGEFLFYPSLEDLRSRLNEGQSFGFGATPHRLSQLAEELAELERDYVVVRFDVVSWSSGSLL